jgi:replicative superfamily II helicase
MRDDQNFSVSLEKLYKKNINQYLNLGNQEKLDFDDSELHQLLSYASIFSLSMDNEDISLAYEICSRLIELYGVNNELVLTTSDVILSRIGNFPGRTLLRSKFLDDSQPRVPFSLAMERLARESENSIGESGLLTDFQYKLYTSLGLEQSLSVSAPTSAGKSYILNLDLVRRLGREFEQCIIYIVPTRALVSEVVSRIRITLRDENIDRIAVRTAPFPILNKEKYQGVVYVLTQERLLRLLSFNVACPIITSLIVDEAHELQKGKRGILLQNSIDLALKKFPTASILFASPLIKNPGYLLDIFNRSRNGRYFTEEISPVSQNVILVSAILKKTNSVTVQLLTKNGVMPLGESKLSFRFRGSKNEQKARFAVEICNKEESVIIFSDNASAAEESAEHIASINENFVISKEIDDFINFIKTEIHPEYPLIKCLKKGVAFHYGNMPSILRSGVEKIFKDGKIRFLCSTSTLLQGVNLPAKHIVIERPHLGDDAMGRADFRNLAGRAGRLLKEFHGNVWCLRPSEWEVDCYRGDNLQEIKSSMERVMADGGTLIGAIVEGDAIKEHHELADAAYSRLYYEVSENGPMVAFSSYQNEQNEDVLRANIAHMNEMKIEIPMTILESHRSLRPDLLQKLFENLKNMPNIEQAILINPHERGGKLSMQTAISAINLAFGLEMSDKYFNWISSLAHNWVWGKPVGEMIVERVLFKRQRNPNEKASPIIRNLFKVIETEVRYKLVKYFAAYEDLLKLAVESRESGKEISVAPYHIYLEFGSSDPATLSLMALGLSRFTAIKLKEAVNWSDEKEPEDYLAKISLIKVKNINLPMLCEQEIYDLLGDI